MRPAFRATSLSEAALDGMVQNFAADIDRGKGTDWMKVINTYAFSKIAVNALVAIHARNVGARPVIFLAMCPGWVKTDMGGDQAPRTVEEGADTALWLATVEQSQLRNGMFYADRAVLDKFCPAL